MSNESRHNVTIYEDGPGNFLCVCSCRYGFRVSSRADGMEWATTHCNRYPQGYSISHRGRSDPDAIEGTSIPIMRTEIQPIQGELV